MNQSLRIIIWLINGIYLLAVLLFFLDGLTSFEIKSQIIKSLTYSIVFIGIPVVVIFNLIFFNSIIRKIAGIIAPLSIIITILMVGPIRLLNVVGTWHTQTVFYENNHFSNRTIEFQMQDVGALGYKKRDVEVFYLTQWFMIVNPIPDGIENSLEWKRVDKEVNELGLKIP